MRRGQIFALMIVLAGCVDTVPLKTTQFNLSPTGEAAVRAGVAAGLKDPYTAHFDRPMVAREAPGFGIHVCGWVNAKNSFGAYTGYVPFSGTLFGDGRFVVDAVGGGDLENNTVRANCARFGIY